MSTQYVGVPDYKVNSDVGFWGENTHTDEWSAGPFFPYVYEKGDVQHSDHHIYPTNWHSEHDYTLSVQPAVSHYRWHDDQGKLLADYKSTRWFGPRYPNEVGPPERFAGIRQNAIDKATNQAREGLARGDLNLGEFVGEARETAEMLADRGSQMALAIKDFRRYSASLGGNKGRLAARFAGAWLEGYYGWGSLARDAFAIHDQLTSQLQNNDLLLSSRGRATDTITDHFGSQNQNEREFTIKAECKYYYRMSNEFVAGATSMGLTNPLSLIWELLPLSFVVDWFTPIGNTLSALGATAGLTFVSGYQNQLQEGKIKMRAETPWPGTFGLVDFDPGLVSHSRTLFERRYTSGFEPPKLYANTNPFNTNRITSAVALITQAVFG